MFNVPVTPVGEGWVKKTGEGCETRSEIWWGYAVGEKLKQKYRKIGMEINQICLGLSVIQGCNIEVRARLLEPGLHLHYVMDAKIQGVVPKLCKPLGPSRYHGA